MPWKLHLPIDVLYTLLGAVVLWVLYSLSGPIVAYVEFRSRPREEMAWCPKHKHFRKQYIIKMGIAEVCPICYLEAIQGADGKVTLFK